MKTLLTAVLLAGLSLHAAAQSQPGPIFTVPLDLKNLHPSITRGRVFCAINPVPATTAADTIATGSVEIPIANQSFRGDVVVRTAYHAGKTAANAKRWTCQAQVLVDGQWMLLGGNQNSPFTNAAGAANGYAPASTAGTY